MAFCNSVNKIFYPPPPSKKANLAEHLAGPLKTSAGNFASSCTPDSPFISSRTEPQLCYVSAINHNLKSQNTTTAFCVLHSPLSLCRAVYSFSWDLGCNRSPSGPFSHCSLQSLYLKYRNTDKEVCGLKNNVSFCFIAAVDELLNNAPYWQSTPLLCPSNNLTHCSTSVNDQSLYNHIYSTKS